MVDPISSHPLDVAYVRQARAVPPGGRVPRDMSVVDALTVLLREFSADDAPVSFRFGHDPAAVVRRVGDGWYASYGAVARGADPGPHGLDWLRRTCSRTGAGHPFDGTSRRWGVTSRVDHAAARPVSVLRDVEPASGDRVAAISEEVGSLALVDGEVLVRVLEPILAFDGSAVAVHLFDARGDPMPSLDGRRRDEALLSRLPHRMFSPGDVDAIVALGGGGALDAAGVRAGPAPLPPSLSPRAAVAHMRHLYATMRCMVADADEAHFTSYRRLRAALEALDGADPADPGTLADVRAAVLDAEDAVAAAAEAWSREPGLAVVARLDMVEPAFALAGFDPG